MSCIYQCLTERAPKSHGPGQKAREGRNGKVCLLLESGCPLCAENRGEGPSLSSARWDLPGVEFVLRA